MSAIPVHRTPVVEREWDGPATVANAPNEPAILRYMHAWMDADADATTKAAYALPHHAPRLGSAAVLPAVRNALARLPQMDRISAADKPAVAEHLRAHLVVREE